MKSRITVLVKEERKKRLKKKAVDEDKTMSQLVDEILEKALVESADV